MKRPASRPKAVNDVLSTVLAQIDPEHALRAYAVWKFWDEEMGEAIARRAQPTEVRNGVLFVKDRAGIRTDANVLQRHTKNMDVIHQCLCP